MATFQSPALIMGRTARMVQNCVVAVFILIALIATQPVSAGRSLLESEDSAKIHHLYWTVSTKNITRNAVMVAIPVVNGQYPGPTVHINEGDTLIVTVTNKVDHEVSIHWHGIRQYLTNWADGVSRITQCSLVKGDSFTYEFTAVNQSGTMFWHGHVHWLRATVYGALIVHPKATPPYPTPVAKIPLLLGEWYAHDPDTIEIEGLATRGPAFETPNAYVINGLTGPLYSGSKEGVKIKVTQGKDYLLQLVNTALINNYFFTIANHTMTVVAMDGEYVKPYSTSVVMILPGQSMDVFISCNSAIGKYYFSLSEWRPLVQMYPPLLSALGVLEYKGAKSSAIPVNAIQPENNDTTLSHSFQESLRGLSNYSIPTKVDREMFLVGAVANIKCDAREDCSKSIVSGTKFGTTLNNVTFELPTKSSILESYYYHNDVNRVYTTDFPSYPTTVANINFTSNSSVIEYNQTTHRGPKVMTLEYNQTVQIVLQDANVWGLDNHPFHLHGHVFYVVGRGMGNYNATTDPKNFNLVDPQVLNTVSLPDGGWVAIRFVANNPGVWLFHCHIDRHTSWGMMTAFIVKNGKTSGSKLPPPKHGLVKCHDS